ncbi:MULTISPECIES: globin [Thioalkalivibrio]|uniref:globin n=1 Tax=Thioalkalivibrio TaxID=106633 RepID=UPI0003678566|nr:MULTISPECIES: globin [Thioalkalivibrio]
MDFSDVHQSYGRCRRAGDFVTRFYEHFLQADPRVKAAFASTDFSQQKRALGQAISTAISYAEGESFVASTMERMGQVHSREGRVPVEPDLYPIWLDCMVRTAAEIDPRWEPRLEERWRGAMQPAIDLFVRLY